MRSIEPGPTGLAARMMRTLSAAALAAATAVLGIGASQSQENFYKDKKVDLYIGYSVGGGYDVYGRLLASHLGRHLPGNPTIVVRNMPGAGSMTLANFIYSVAPKDGTALGAIAGGAVTAPLFNYKAAKYDSRQYTWVGSISGDVALTVAWHTAGFKTIKDVFEREFIVGTAGASSGNHTYPAALNAVLGTKFKLVPGYPGNTEIALAMERGEVQGVASWHVSGIQQSRPTWLKENLIIPLLQISLRKHPTLPDVPLVLDLARTKEERQLLATLFAQQTFSRPIIAPPNVPAAQAKMLQEAFNKTMQDPEFLAEAEKRRLEINDPMSGPDIKALLDELYATPPEVVDRAAKAIATN